MFRVKGQEFRVWDILTLTLKGLISLRLLGPKTLLVPIIEAEGTIGLRVFGVYFRSSKGPAVQGDPAVGDKIYLNPKEPTFLWFLNMTSLCKLSPYNGRLFLGVGSKTRSAGFCGFCMGALGFGCVVDRLVFAGCRSIHSLLVEFQPLWEC